MSGANASPIGRSNKLMARRVRVSEGVNELESSLIPLLASPQGGVAERSIKCRGASADSEAGVVFRFESTRKTTPAASALDAARNVFDDAALPSLR